MTISDDNDDRDELRRSLRAVRRRLRVLTVAVLLLTLAVLLCTMAVFANLVNYFGGDTLLQGGVAAATAALGFGFGWFAARKA